MSFLINSYEMRPPAVTLGGLAAMSFDPSAELIAALIAEGVPMVGSAGMVTGGAGTTQRAARMGGASDLLLSLTGGLRAKRKIAGKSILTAGQVGSLGVPMVMAGGSAITAGQSADLVCDYGTVMDPTLSPSGGIMANGYITIHTGPPPEELLQPYPPDQVFWTHDGADPVVAMDENGVWTSTNGTPYTGPIHTSISWGWTFTIKAIATKQNWEPSSVVTVPYQVYMA